MAEEDKIKILKDVHGELYDDLVREWSMRTICEVLREIYWLTKDQEIRDRVKESMVMAKAMDRRLTEYYNEAHPESEIRYDEGIWKPNPFKDQKREEQALRELEECEQ